MEIFKAAMDGLVKVFVFAAKAVMLIVAAGVAIVVIIVKAANN